MYVAQKYNMYNGLTGHVQYSRCVDVLKAAFVRVQRDSSQLSISLKSGDGQQRKTLLRHKAAPRPEPHASHHTTAEGKPSWSWLMTTVLWLRVKWATVLPITLFRLACGWCQRAQQLRHDSGIMALLSRWDNNLIPVVSLCSGNMQIPQSIFK